MIDWLEKSFWLFWLVALVQWNSSSSLYKLRMLLSYALQGALITILRHCWSCRQLFEIFTHPMPQCQSTRFKSLQHEQSNSGQLRRTHTMNVTHATIKQNMQLNLLNFFANVYRLTWSNTNVRTEHEQSKNRGRTEHEQSKNRARTEQEQSKSRTFAKCTFVRRNPGARKIFIFSKNICEGRKG